MAKRADDEGKKSGGLFDDLSLAQVAAGALAAVTSMLLASQIGIYGSVIGVGVGSIVSTVASQLYKKFLQRSADKLRELNPGETLGGQKRKGEGAQEREGGSARPTEAYAPAPRSSTPNADDASLRGDAAVQRARAERLHKKKLKRGVLVVSIVSALLAVAVSAFLVNAVSAGQGVGQKTEPLLPSRSQPTGDDAPAAPSDEGTAKDPSSSSSQGSASDEGSKSEEKPSQGDQGSSGTSEDPNAADPGSNEGSTSGDQGASGSPDSPSGSSGSGDGPSVGGSGSKDDGSGSGAGSSGSNAGSSLGGGPSAESSASSASAADVSSIGEH